MDEDSNNNDCEVASLADSSEGNDDAISDQGSLGNHCDTGTWDEDEDGNRAVIPPPF